MAGQRKLDSRERVFLALDHQAGDRIPVDFWATPGVVARLETELGLSHERFLDHYDVDFRYIDGPLFVGPARPPETDIWGVSRQAVPACDKCEAYSEVTSAPLRNAESPADIDAYPHWPNPDWFDYSGIEAQCDAAIEGRRVVVFMGDRLNRIAQLKCAMYLRGTEEILLDMALREDIARRIFDTIKNFYVSYTERILDAARGKIDIVLTGDDFGAQNGLLISPAHWRSHLRPGFTDYLGLIKSYGAKTMHHTCGSVLEIIPDMIDCGLDILQSVQPEAHGMSLTDLKRRFGRDISFQGGVSIQKTMPYGSQDDVRNEVRAIADVVGNGGGYIFCTSHNIQADTPTANITALLKAYADYGAA